MPTSKLARTVAALFAMVLLFGCVETEAEWVQYNAADDSIEISVGVADVEEEATVSLYSSTGLLEIGTATVSPAGGPIGTEHAILVDVFADYENDVDRVSVRTSSESRGEDEYDLDADTASEGLYATSLISVGETEEVRTDTLTFRLWYDANRDTGG